MASLTTRLVSIGCGALVLAAGTPGQADADPAFFESQAGRCGQSLPPAPVSTPHESVGVRLSLTTPDDGFWTGPFGENLFSDADVIWEAAGDVPVAADLSDYSSVYCEGGDYRLDWFDVPTAPTSFSGVTSANGQSDGSALPFVVRGGGPYVADVTLSGGAITLGLGYESSAPLVSSTQNFRLGSLEAGEHVLRVDGEDGPSARWTVSVRPAPVTLSAVSLTPDAIRPGELAKLEYSLDGDASVDVTITGAGFERRLVSAFAAGPGTHAVRWDGRAADGSAVPDGTYQATVTATDAQGQRQEQSTSIEVDGTRRIALGVPDWAPNGKGWGRVRPRTIYNGGVPSGLVVKIRWRDWGAETATGRGRTSLYRPTGGYFKRRGRIDLRAKDVGTCPGRSGFSYRQLQVRVAKRPGGRMGRWFLWSGDEDLCA